MALLVMAYFAPSGIGIKASIETYFYSYVVTWIVPTTEIAIPFFPGGYTIGIILVINLIVSLITRFRLDSRRVSLSIAYVGVILFIVAEFINSSQSKSSVMILKTDESSRYSENVDKVEIALVDFSSDSGSERVFAIPQEMLEREREIRVDELPFIISVDSFLPHSLIVDRKPETALTGPIASEGFGKRKTAFPQARGFDKKRNSSAYVTLYSDKEIIGTWLLSESFDEQIFEYADRSYRLRLHSERYYHPFNLSLKDIHKDYHAGTSALQSLEVILEMLDDSESSPKILSVSPGEPVEIDGITLFVNSRDLHLESLKLNLSTQPAKRLFIAATIVISVGFIARTVAFLFVWLRENAKEAP